jgi:two-component system response regulator AtoC
VDSHVDLRSNAPASVGAPSRPTLAPPGPVSTRAPNGGGASNLREEMQSIERERVRAALDACAGNQTRAAAMLGISRRTLISRIEIFGISRPTKG